MEGLNEWVTRNMSGTLYLLLGAVLLLLAIGCGNVSILLLARGTARQHELAVRSAVGANRSRLRQQLLTESLLLAIAGAVLGVLFSYGILAGIKALLPRYAFAPEVVVSINLPVLSFSVAEWQQEHLAAWIFGVFAMLALGLAAVGLYSVVSYAVAQRTAEFGIRMALGAQRADVLRAVFAANLVSIGSGILAGLLLAMALNGILQRWAEGSSRDPLTLLAGSVLLSVVSAVACAIPAQHAARIDPMSALRFE